MKSTFTVLISWLFVTMSWAQDCTTTIDLDPNVDLCMPGSTILNPSINGDFLSFSWSPVSGLSDPDQLLTTATVTEDIIYTLSVNSISNTELITNGDFSMGDTGFTSDYIYGTGGGVGLLSNEGQYAIANNAGDTHNQFANCSDHTGGGNMMVVNASGDASNLWCQNITVEVGTNYSFSAWVTSVTSQNPAQLQFSVNGAPLGTPFNASSSTCNWQGFSAEWTSGATTSAEICIVNTNFTPAGNDFALDDISFRKICVTEASVNIAVLQLDASVNIPATICSLAADFDLSTLFTNETTPGGQWTLDGATITTFNPSTLSNTSHTLQYMVNNGNCSDSSQGVFGLAQPPNAGTADYFTTCFDIGSAFQVNLSDIITNEDPGGVWQYLAGPTSASINVSTGDFSGTEAGFYQYYYIVSGNAACPQDTLVQNFDLNFNPIADLPATASLDCIVDEVILEGANTSIGNNFAYRWFRNGLPLTDQFMRSLTVNQAATYLLEVRDENTGCIAEATTVVNSLVGSLSFELSTQAAACDDIASGTISVENVSGGTMPYLYSIDGVNFSPDTSFTNLSPGTYQVYTQDAGGCEDSLSTNLPMPIIPEVILQASGDTELQLGESAVINVISNPPLSELDTIIWVPMLSDSNRISEKQWLVQPNETTNYSVLVLDNNGCSGTAELLLSVRPEGNVFIPNAISPNEDGTNDRFIFFDQGSIANISSLMIFDRWGALVYQAKDLQANSSDRAWDGRYEGTRLPAGVYIYSAQVEWINGKLSQIQGEVSLIY
jgi:gliding motility-associated-like protein